MDTSGGSATRDYVLAVSLPPLPSVSMDGLPDPTNAADQPAFSVSLATAYPVQLTGQIVATFAADAEIAIDERGHPVSYRRADREFYNTRG